MEKLTNMFSTVRFDSLLIPNLALMQCKYMQKVKHFAKTVFLNGRKSAHHSLKVMFLIFFGYNIHNFYKQISKISKVKKSKADSRSENNNSAAT